MFGEDEAHGAVGEDEEGFVALGGEAVLDVGGDGVGHHHGAYEFEEEGRFDDLDVSPEVAGVVAEVAEPASADGGFDFEVHLGEGADGFEEGIPDDFGRGGDEGFFFDEEGLDGFGGGGGGHGHGDVPFRFEFRVSSLKTILDGFESAHFDALKAESADEHCQ